MSDEMVADVLALLDWRRRIAELYAEIRASSDAQTAWRSWQATRSTLFREHPHSPVAPPERMTFSGPHAYRYDPSWRILAEVEPAQSGRFELPTSTGVAMAFSRFGRAAFTFGASELSLDLYLLEGYGGGLFVPFADSTSGTETYGAGRYLLDTMKGADLGQQDERLVFDFNFAYQPSCSYDPRWTCPLAPPDNRLPIAVRAGERLAATQSSAIRATSR
ncbi:MAG: DUF1684 domain-containing protein [Solirubrobacteraceae bacterium]